jgi:integrase
MTIRYNRLTAAGQRSLAEDEEITEHGISFRRLANNDGVYTVNVMVDGRRVHRVVGRQSDGTTRTQAEEFIAKVRTDAKHDRLSLPKGRKVVLSFKDAATKYLELLEQEGGKNIERKRVQLRMHLTPFFGDLPLSKISGFDLERYKKQRRAQLVIKSNVKGKGPTFKENGPSVGTVNRELAVLSHLCNKAIEWGWIDRRPAKIVRFREDSGRIIYLTVEQARSLVEQARGDACAHIYPFVVIALGTSMRKTEILSLQKGQVDLERRRIYLPKAKAGTREQPITAEVADFLRSHIAGLPTGVPWLFPSPAARKGHAVDIRKPFRRVVAAIGLDPNVVVRHTLRHTAITHLVQAGVDLPTVKRISGHKTLVMVERYAHANGAHIQTAMDKLTARYAGEEAKPEQDVAANQLRVASA